MNIISEILFLCQQNNLSQEEKEQLNYIFSNKIIDVNYDDYSFILISSFYGNSDMINILKNNNADIHIYNDKPYCLAMQNNNIECINLLLAPRNSELEQ